MTTNNKKKQETKKGSVALFGEKLLSSLDKTELTSNILKDKNLVLLYFR